MFWDQQHLDLLNQTSMGTSRYSFLLFFSYSFWRDCCPEMCKVSHLLNSDKYHEVFLSVVYCVFYISFLSSKACCVLSQCNTWLRLLYLLNRVRLTPKLLSPAYAWINVTKCRRKQDGALDPYISFCEFMTVHVCI